ncbi:MAG TPA: YidB family protein [Pseudaminobacter sp.]|jgi:uncharacterized protein YidB (DUF937 family)|nr:YidB family protein [Pseudaminobacter sp.]
MGLLDDAVPGGNITKPLLVALGVLLAGKMFTRKGQEEDQATPEPAQVPDRRSPQADTPIGRDAGPGAPRQQTPDNQAGGKNDGGIVGGLEDLLDRLKKTGQGETADSWVKPGANKPIEPGELGKAVGQRTLSEISRQAGVSEEELLRQLSKVLPGVVDKLTPTGTVPSNKEVAQNLPSSPW